MTRPTLLIHSKCAHSLDTVGVGRSFRDKTYHDVTIFGQTIQHRIEASPASSSQERGVISQIFEAIITTVARLSGQDRCCFGRCGVDDVVDLEKMRSGRHENISNEFRGFEYGLRYSRLFMAEPSIEETMAASNTRPLYLASIA